MSYASRLKKTVVTTAAAVAMVFAFLIPAQPAAAAYGTISVSFGDWRCAATGGGKVVGVQMGSQYGSVPRVSGRTIRIQARTGVKNSLTGVLWCKRPWYRGGLTTPVYHVHQGLWVSRVGQHFNV